MQIIFEEETKTMTPSFGAHEEYEATIELTNIINDVKVLAPEEEWEVCSDIVGKFLRIYTDRTVTLLLNETIPIVVTRFAVLHIDFASVKITAGDTAEVTTACKIMVGHNGAVPEP